MNKKVVLPGIIGFSLLSSALSFPVITFASSSQDDSIPTEVIEKVKKKEAEVQFEIPETKAWEVSLDGEITEVSPINEQPDPSVYGIYAMAVPSDGYTYSFEYYDVNGPTRDWNYESAGTVRVNNNLTYPAQFTYKQTSDKTTNWKVSTSITGSAKIKTSFLGEVGAEVGLEVSGGKTWTAGTSYGISTTVPAKSTAYLTAWAVGVNDFGKLVYKKYTSSGTMVGYYYETAGGTAVSKNDANIELSEISPF